MGFGNICLLRLCAKPYWTGQPSAPIVIRVLPVVTLWWQGIQRERRLLISFDPPLCKGTMWSHSLAWRLWSGGQSTHSYPSRMNTSLRIFIHLRPRMRLWMIISSPFQAGGCLATNSLIATYARVYTPWCGAYFLEITRIVQWFQWMGMSQIELRGFKIALIGLLLA